MIRLLLDENISPTLVARLGEHDVYALSVPHVGLSGRPDREIWDYALANDFSVVTINARDFVGLLNKASGDDDFLLNKLVEIIDPGQWEIREIPTS